MNSTRKIDTIVEREISEFLDENLYTDSTIFKEFIRTDNLDDQLLGSDVIISTWDGNLNYAIVDEKVAARYANKKLNTFALELSFINRLGNENVGWFIDETKKTEYYLCGWITNSTIQYNKDLGRYETETITKDNICSMDWCLVSREKIFEHLAERGWSIDRIKRQCEKIRKNGMVRTNQYIQGVSFRYSDKLAEKPINLLMKKNTYFEISDYCGTITANEDF